ncbi:putative lysozyme [Arthrobacter globiformis NBRC 12137]|uniref:lysozyme n=2 Tax=Arthrobacter globiformis TaxID=1665 RepID=H0QRS4_ARTG1|nr:putative lysozyme [Arthrobacter globiformis NBRC 12137]
MGLKTAKTSATSRLSARNLKATEYHMNCSPNSRISAALALKARRVALLSGTALLSTMLCLGGGLPAQAAPASPTAPPAPEAPATTAPASPTAAATEPEPGQIDMAALRAEIGKDGAYLGQGVKRRAATFAKQSTASSLNAISTEAANTWMAPGVQGLDVSSHQTTVNWAAQYSMGARFAYVKATEGTTYKNPYFGTQYGGALASGMIRGAYHFALPGVSTAAAQADYFVNNGGGWTGDGKTMPPLLDIEYNPYASLGNTCYNMSQTAMVNWIAAFSNRVLARTGRLPMIYTTTDWWTQCTGNSGAFSRQPLHLASYSRYVGSMPNGWGTYSVWQYSATGPFAGDSNAWNGTLAGLQKFAATADGAVPTPSITSLGDVVAADSSGILWDYPATGSGTFRTRKQIGVGWSGLRSINAIDWNADGVLDLIAQWNTGRVNVYLGVAAGGFATGPVLAASGWEDNQLTVGYWYNSSYYPQIISRDDSGVLRLWRNTSGAGVSGGTAIAQGWGGLNLTMIDFDGDGSQDILAQNPAGQLLLYRTNGSGTFVAEARRTIGSGWHNMTSVTVTTNFKGAATNGLMARNTSGQLYYYPVPGNSAWGPVSAIGTGWNNYLIAGGETVNVATAPPTPPAVTPSITSASDVVTVDPSGNVYRRSSGTGTLGTAAKIGTGFTGLASVHVTDWNADGIQDLATLSTTGVLGIQTGLPAGGFAARTVLASGLTGADVTFGPWLKAAKYPGVVVRRADGSVQFHANPSGGAPAPATTLASGFARTDISMADADGDGNQDLVAVDYLGRMTLHRSGGTGTLVSEARKLLAGGWNTMNSISPARGFAAAGSNGLLARDRSGQLSYYPLTAGTLGAKSVLPSGWNGLLIGGSGLLVPGRAITGTADILTVDAAGGLWNRPAGNSSVGSPYQIGVGWSGMKSLNVVDWNSDGVADVLAQRSNGMLSLYPGSASGGFAAPFTVASTGFAQTTLVTGKWVSGSRYPGLVGYGTDGALYFWANATGRTVSAPVRIGAGWSGLKLAMIDYDSDGKQDLLAVNSTGAMRLYRSTGANRFISEARKTVGSGWQSFRQFSANKGFAGTTSKGVMAVQSDGQLRYYPVVAGSRWGTSFIAGSVGTASTVSSTSGAS